MIRSKKDFGTFGSGAQTSVPPEDSSFFGKLFRIGFIFLIAALVPFALTGWGDFYQNIVEREPPLIEIKKPPVGLGIEPVDVALTIRDKHSGIDQVTIKIEQAGKSQNVLKKDYTQRLRVDDLKISLNGKELGLREGEAHLRITAYDKSFWSNGAATAVQLRVDYTKPEVTVYPDQRNAVTGGVEMVFYRLRDPADMFSGVMIGSDLLPGFPAKNFDREFENLPEIYCAFFPISRDFNPDHGGLRVFARDAVGNMTSQPVSYRVQSASFKQSVVQVTPEMLAAKVDPLYEQYSLRQARLNGQDPMKLLPSGSDEERIQRFHAINEDYRDLLSRAMKPLFAKPKAERIWKGPFARFSTREQQSFGERVTFQYGSQVLGQYVEAGVLFPSSLETPVRASNNGIVIYADDLGVYGKTVIVDHGFGLTSLYGHLSAISRLEGDRVERGDVIGKVGETGLVFGPALKYEMRMHGVPVRPIEWWDAKWLEDHIEGKVRNAKRAVGMRAVEELE